MPLPGVPAAVEDACRQLNAAVVEVRSTGESVAAHGRTITADWTGLAAPLALARTQQDAANAQRVAQAVTDSVGPLMRYAEELRAAHQDHARGEGMVAQGQAAVSALGSEPAAEAGRDRAQQALDEGTALMRTAEERARAANEAAARALDAATASLGGTAPPPTAPAAASTSPLTEVGKAAASVGMAALEHPLDVAAIVGGGTLAAVSAAGALGSVALDGTGVGLLAGVPLGGASAAGLAAGVGIAGAGLVDLATHAATDSSVAPLQVDQKNSSKELPDNPTGRTIRDATNPGKQDHVREAPSDEAVRELADELMRDKERYKQGSHPGDWVTTDDGTKVGLREESGSGGPTIDLKFPNGDNWKVHRPLGG